MVELTVEERKSNLIRILDEIHSFCEDNDIKYYLHAGTLLGAVRHNGFIPWDDDLDICMPRPEYEKFLLKFNSQNLYISHYKNKEKNARPFMKVCLSNTYATNMNGKNLHYGLGIDVFPIDGYPNNENDCKKFFKKQDLLFHYLYVPASMFESEMANKTFFREIIIKLLGCILFRWMPTFKISELIDMRSKKNLYSESVYAGCSVGIFRRKIEKVYRSSFDSGFLHDFETKKYYIPSGYDEILKSIYGQDYMTPPPEDKRETTHCEMYFYKDR